MVVVLLLGSSAQAAYLCATRKGAVKLRETCKPKETVIDPLALGLQGPKGDKGDPGEPGAPGGFAGSATMAQTAGSVDGFVDCQLESSTNDGAYTVLATTSAAGRELFFSESFPAFTVGATIQFRVSCLVTAGTRTVVAANIGAIASSAGILD